MFSSINSRGSTISNHLNAFFNITNFQSTDISGIAVTGTQPYNVYAFTNTGITYNINYYFPTNTIMYVLAVGGGGGGATAKQPSDGTAAAGGGGAGGVVMTSVTLKGGLNNFTINVGSGGAGAVYTGPTTVPGNQGNNTTISFKSNNVYDISAGGGQGGQTGVVYNNLGSAGGGSTSSSVPNSGRYYTIFANGSLATGGGGGARTPGGLLSGTAGGVGIKCNLNGIKDFNPSGNKPYGLYYWGGGGAGSPGIYCSGGLGGGGGGAINYGVAPYSINGLGDTNGINPASNSVLTGNGYYFQGGYGGKNTGGGGGAGDISSNYYGNGGAGGSGIVVIAFSYFFTPANLLITDNLVINLDSSVFDISCNWIDQTAKGYSYTQYNAYSTSNVVYGSTSPITPIDISKNYTNNYPVVQLNGSSNVTKYLWMNAVNNFGSSNLLTTNFTGSYTYEIWVYPTAIKNATLINEVGTNPGGTSGWTDDQMALSSSTFVTSYYYNAGGYVTSDISYNINNWYQIINVYTGGTTYLTQYINGKNSKILNSNPAAAKLNPQSGSLVIGSNAGNAASYMGGLGTFQGYIGSFRGYNIALSTSQILQNYNYYRPTIFSFNPNSITGLSLWLDASDLSNNAFGSAPIYNYRNIGQFVNKATGTIYKGSGNITLNSIGLNNRPTLQFTGTQDFSGNIIITGQYVAIYIVGTNNYLNSPKTLYPRIIALTGAKSEADYTNPLYCIVGTLQTLIYSQKNSILSDCSNISNLNPFLFCNWFDNINVNTVCYTNSNVSYNTKPNVGNFDISYVTIGSGHQSNNNSYFIGNISEILVYSSSTVCSTATSSANNRAIIEGYLSWKWGLQGNLPTNHAYYNYPP
jgi:hypothetical protein